MNNDTTYYLVTTKVDTQKNNYVFLHKENKQSETNIK